MATGDNFDVSLLRGGDLEVVGRLIDASNASLLCKLKNGLQVIYKPIAGERPLWDFKSGSLAGREVAAFELSQLGGFNLVPATVLREGPFGKGAVQRWIVIDEGIDVVKFGTSQDERLRQMVLFDAIINNTDRKFGHLLISREGELYGCDHGVCFHSDDKLRTVLWQWAGEKITSSETECLESLKSLIPDSGLADYLESQEIKAMEVRINRILETGVLPEPAQDWPAVPYPPY